jgi:hypothetical protein
MVLPVGTNRLIQVFGFQATDCSVGTSFADYINQKRLAGSTQSIFEVGRAITDITAAGSVSISSSYDATIPKEFISCNPSTGIASLKIYPETATILQGETSTVSFAASGGSSSTYTYSISGTAGGSITAGGVYTPGTYGTETIQVTDGSTTKTATLTVLNSIGAPAFWYRADEFNHPSAWPEGPFSASWPYHGAPTQALYLNIDSTDPANIRPVFNQQVGAINNRSAIKFVSGIGYEVSTVSLPTTAELIVFAVMKYGSAVGSFFCLGSACNSSGADYLSLFQTSSGLRFQSEVNQSSTETVALNSVQDTYHNWNVHMVRFRYGEPVMYAVGSEIKEVSTAINSSLALGSNFFLGKKVTAGTNDFNGSIAEILIYANPGNTVNNTTAAQIAQYLGTYYGLPTVP